MPLRPISTLHEELSTSVIAQGAKTLQVSGRFSCQNEKSDLIRVSMLSRCKNLIKIAVLYHERASLLFSAYGQLHTLV
jgi:hypothetical protein